MAQSIVLKILIMAFISIKLSFAMGKDGYVSEIIFSHGEKIAHYALSEDHRKKTFTLHKLKNKNEIKSKVVKAKTGENIKNKINQILWQVKYQRGISSRVCSKYAMLKINNDEAEVCMENKNVVGSTYGLLNLIATSLE